jgi:WD40 repeat protein/serine/threonine protein kinase
MNAEEIFHKVVEISDPAERAAYLDDACKEDPKLRAEVEELLKAHEQAGDFLEVPPLGAGATLDKSSSIEGPGTRIGHYELLELIGEGGMGLVYLAEQKEPVKRRVAFKIIKPGMDSKQVIARFEAERQALAVLDHPNIARVFDAGTTDTGRPYFVMEYVKGMSITRYCDERKLDIEQRLRLFEQICEAVHHAHQKGIIHRDIKPSNILVSVHGDRAVPKIIDFGIAKAITQPLTDKTFVTFQGQLLGTPEYMSPEQVDLATQDIDTRSDIYSLGVVLYELLAGVLPFEHESFERVGFAEIQQMVREQEPDSPSIRLTHLGEKAKTIAASRSTQVIALARRLHRELEWIPLKAMRKDRCRRYRSASELADDIRNYLNGLPLIAGPETAVYRVQKFVRRHAGSVATVALVFAAIVLGLIVSTAMYFRAEAMRAQAEQAREKETIARNQAEQAEKVAQEQKNIAETKTEDLRRSLYVNSIQLADIKYREGNIRRVRELLDSCPNDLRGWEWNRLNYVSDQSLMTLRGHKGWVYSVAVSPDSKRVISGGDADGTIRVWDLTTGETLKTLAGHTGTIRSLAFSPDGKKIISGSMDKTIKVWDAETGAEVMTLRRDSYVSSVAISPDGRRIVSVSGRKIIKVWDAETGEELKTLRGRFSQAAFSPDGKRIVAGGMITTVWDSVSGIELMTLEGHKGLVTSVSFSPDGKRIVSGDTDIIKIWDAETGVEIATLRRGQESRTESVAFSPDGRFIVSGTKPNAVSVWDVSGSGEVKTFRGHEGFVISSAFTPDGKQIVSGSSDGTIKVWDATIDREVTKLIGHRQYVYSMAFSPDGERIVSGGYDNTIRMWDVGSGAEVMTLRGHQDWVKSVAFSADGKRIVSGSNDKTVKTWDVKTGAEAMTLHGDQRVWCVAISPNGKQIVSEYGGKIKLWDAEAGEQLKTLKGHEPNSVFSVAFSPDGKRIVSGGTDNMVRVWDSVSADELMTLQGHGKWVTSVAFSPDGKHIASGDDGGIVKVWDSATGAERRTLRAHGSYVKSVAFSPDSKRVLTGALDATIKIWDAASGAELMSVDSGVGLYSVAFSPDGKSIAAAGSENIMLWESAPPAGGYGPRRAVIAAQIERSRKAEDTWKFMWEIGKEMDKAFGLPGGDPNAYRAALEKFEKANLMDPNNPDALFALYMIQYSTGQYEEAIKTLTKAHDLEPNEPAILGVLSDTQYRAGKYEDAIKTLTEVLEMERRVRGEQKRPSSMNRLAWMQATCPAAEVRNGAEAVKNATRACELTQWKKAQYVNTLAAAYAEVGDFESAVKWQKEAIRLLTEEDPAEWPAEFQERLRLYESGKPYRESP